FWTGTNSFHIDKLLLMAKQFSIVSLRHGIRLPYLNWFHLILKEVDSYRKHPTFNRLQPALGTS
ncbi:MAG: hypothetical protein ACNYPE_13760, partial [Candidatus Azotimanducaceae bacterium WSBS_2022_MAG_OTU7]